MNEAETHAELIAPNRLAAGWGALERMKIRREYHITNRLIFSNLFCPAGAAALIF